MRNAFMRGCTVRVSPTATQEQKDLPIQQEYAKLGFEKVTADIKNLNLQLFNKQ